jgi:hypothetical protein
VNQSVHLCIRGCLTLKLSLSWKTVTCSAGSTRGFLFSSLFAPSGEIGIVDRSTGMSGLTGVWGGSVSVIVAVNREGDMV